MPFCLAWLGICASFSSSQDHLYPLDAWDSVFDRPFGRAESCTPLGEASAADSDSDSDHTGCWYVTGTEYGAWGYLRARHTQLDYMARTIQVRLSGGVHAAELTTWSGIRYVSDLHGELLASSCAVYFSFDDGWRTDWLCGHDLFD